MLDTLYFGVPAVAFIIALTEVIKRAGIPSRFSPLINIAFGIIIACLGAWKIDVNGIVAGIVLGLSASGIWDISKKTILAK